MLDLCAVSIEDETPIIFAGEHLSAFSLFFPSIWFVVFPFICINFPLKIGIILLTFLRGSSKAEFTGIPKGFTAGNSGIPGVCLLLTDFSVASTLALSVPLELLEWERVSGSLIQRSILWLFSVLHGEEILGKDCFLGGACVTEATQTISPANFMCLDFISCNTVRVAKLNELDLKIW